MTPAQEALSLLRRLAVSAQQDANADDLTDEERKQKTARAVDIGECMFRAGVILRNDLLGDCPAFWGEVEAVARQRHPSLQVYEDTELGWGWCLDRRWEAGDQRVYDATDGHPTDWIATVTGETRAEVLLAALQHLAAPTEPAPIRRPDACD